MVIDVTLNAENGIIKEYTKGCIMKKIYKKRRDIIDMIGKESGYLKVIKYAGKDKWRGAHWLCQCKCGNECKIKGSEIRSGSRVSCGCKAEARIDEVGVNRIYSNYKRKAGLRKIEFDLSKDDFKKLIKSNCTYCGTEPHNILKRQKSRKLQILYNGIDRVDSSKSYTISNCVPCCRYCNQSKSDLSLDQWKEYLKRVYKWLSIDSL
jgi:hypothetical protein